MKSSNQPVARVSGKANQSLGPAKPATRAISDTDPIAEYEQAYEVGDPGCERVKYAMWRLYPCGAITVERDDGGERVVTDVDEAPEELFPERSNSIRRCDLCGTVFDRDFGLVDDSGDYCAACEDATISQQEFGPPSIEEQRAAFARKLEDKG